MHFIFIMLDQFKAKSWHCGCGQMQIYWSCFSSRYSEKTFYSELVQPASWQLVQTTALESTLPSSSCSESRASWWTAIGFWGRGGNSGPWHCKINMCVTFLLCKIWTMLLDFYQSTRQTSKVPKVMLNCLFKIKILHPTQFLTSSLKQWNSGAWPLPGEMSLNP